ncbi:MAG: phenylalanine--tRNA ligase subunit beta [Nitrososphaerales archaeon]
MPVITLYYDKLKSLIKGELSEKDLLDKIPYIGVTLEEATDEYVKIEYNPNRPDFSTIYGIVRSLNGILGFEKGAPNYVIKSGEVEIIVDESTQIIRPFIVGLVARGINLNDESIQEIISMQEDLHEGIGRRRRKMSIGIHNFDVLKPPIRYTTVSPEFKFIPLGEENEMSMKEILEKTEVGREYGYIVSSFDKYPLIIDSLNHVLSFPPIINGELTRLTPETKNLFVEITATNLKADEDALSIIASALSDMGAKIESVKIRIGNSIKITPDMSHQQIEVNRKLANDLLGLRLDDKEIIECLERSRISVLSKDGKLIALIPRYRVDILHQVDLVEEIAYGYGFDKLTPTLPSSKKTGKYNENLLLIRSARDVMIGLGFIEVMNYHLISQKALYDFTRRKAKKMIKVENPKSIEYEFLRDNIFPSLLIVLSKNLHEEYPQKIFEISKVFYSDLRAPNGIREDYHLATAVSHSTANYTEVKSILSSLFLQAFNLSVDTIPTYHPSFSSGRVAKIVSMKQNIGMIGEIHPLVLENFRLRNPVSVFEINLSRVIDIVKQNY